jgi:cytochrome bd-type quinol oxidase subunit 1
VINRRIGSTLVAVALAVTTSAAWACDKHADAAEAKDAPDVKVAAANGDAKPCSMPCCAKAKTATTAKESPEKAAAAATASKTKPAQDAPPAAPAADSGTHR